eukprot:TRINITY_DN10499_c0_g1_i2.p1 TRINITY_DN10499_c0_g1~~TRINITY_DN10499_c0_g1_i2.p1  ORF type:complete len:287 (-),score=19.46 TRINITY_DN10499_c0_g1_i2:4-864(-)
MYQRRAQLTKLVVSHYIGSGVRGPQQAVFDQGQQIKQWGFQLNLNRKFAKPVVEVINYEVEGTMAPSQSIQLNKRLLECSSLSELEKVIEENTFNLDYLHVSNGIILADRLAHKEGVEIEQLERVMRLLAWKLTPEVLDQMGGLELGSIMYTLPQSKLIKRRLGGQMYNLLIREATRRAGSLQSGDLSFIMLAIGHSNALTEPQHWKKILTATRKCLPKFGSTELCSLAYSIARRGWDAYDQEFFDNLIRISTSKIEDFDLSDTRPIIHVQASEEITLKEEIQPLT